MSNGSWLGAPRAAWLALGGVVAVVVVVVVVLLASGGGGSHDTTAVASAPAPTTASPAKDPAVEESLRHGIMVVVVDQPSSTGIYAEQNGSISQGVALAANDVNASGGLLGHVHIKLLREDLDTLTPKAIQARLRSQAAVALVLPCDTESQSRLAGAAAGSGTLVLAPCNAEDGNSAKYASYWPVGVGGAQEAEGLVHFMNEIGYGTVFVVNGQGNHYVELLTKDFRAAAKKGGVQVVGEYPVAVGYANLQAAVSAIQHTSPTPSAIFTALPRQRRTSWAPTFRRSARPNPCW